MYVGFTTIPSKLYNTSKDTLLSAKLNACFQYNISRGGVDLTIEVTLQGRNSDGNLVCSVEITKHTDHRRNVSHQISVAEAKNAVWEVCLCVCVCANIRVCVCVCMCVCVCVCMI